MLDLDSLRHRDADAAEFHARNQRDSARSDVGRINHKRRGRGLEDAGGDMSEKVVLVLCQVDDLLHPLVGEIPLLKRRGRPFPVEIPLHDVQQPVGADRRILPGMYSADLFVRHLDVDGAAADIHQHVQHAFQALKVSVAQLFPARSLQAGPVDDARHSAGSDWPRSTGNGQLQPGSGHRVLDSLRRDVHLIGINRCAERFLVQRAKDKLAHALFQPLGVFLAFLHKGAHLVVVGKADFSVVEDKVRCVFHVSKSSVFYVVMFGFLYIYKEGRPF